MILLKINVEMFVKAYAEFIMNFANDLAIDMLNNMRSQFKTEKARNDNEIVYAQLIGDKISVQIKNNILAILDSYGTGSKMDTDNEFLYEYIGSKYWNELRQGFAIVGRPEGEYKNIFGDTEYSSGKMAGRNLDFLARNPSYAIQHTEEVFISQRIQRDIDKATVEWIKGNAFKYFYNSNV